MSLQIDKAPVLEPIAGKLSNSWARWFNQCYASVSGLISQFGTLSSSLTTLQGTVTTQGSSLSSLQGTAAAQGSSLAALQGTVAGIQTNGTLTNPTLAGNVTLPSSGLSIGTNWTSYSPSPSPSGAMTITGLTVYECAYFRIGGLCFFRISVSLTLGGTTSNTVSFSLPFASVVAGSYVSCSAFVGSSLAFAQVAPQSATVQVLPNGLGNYAAGTYYFSVSGFYRCA